MAASINAGELKQIAAELERATAQHQQEEAAFDALISAPCDCPDEKRDDRPRRLRHETLGRDQKVLQGRKETFDPIPIGARNRRKTLVDRLL